LNFAQAKQATMKTDWSALRRQREGAGRRAESAAALWLRLKGYRILERRVRTPMGEIDIVAARDRMLVFVEVKSRASLAAAQEAVTPEARRRIAEAARLWVSRHRRMHDWRWRFDIVALAPGRLPKHLRDAWRQEAPAN
jgi:putative endonuclease